MNVADEYDSGASEYDQRFFESAPTITRFERMERVYNSLVCDGARVLEIGCGTGRVMSKLKPALVVGLDVSSGMLAQARKRGLTVVQGDAHALPFASGRFDAVIASNIVFRYVDWRTAFAEARRVLVPGGNLAVHMNASFTLSREALLFKRREASSLNNVDRIKDFVSVAKAVGLTIQSIALWRSIRFSPYLLKIPVWAPLHLWNHGMFVFHTAHQDTRDANES